MLSAARLPVSQRPFTASRRGAVQVSAKFNYAPVVQEIAKDMMKKQIPRMDVGDTVKVGLAVSEGKGKTRTQTLEGTIIAQHGSGLNKTVTFRRVFQGVGIELIMPIHSPILQKVDLVRAGKVRRSKLYFLRDRVGKAAKLKEVIQTKAMRAARAASSAAKAAAAAAPAASS